MNQDNLYKVIIPGETDKHIPPGSVIKAVKTQNTERHCFCKLQIQNLQHSLVDKVKVIKRKSHFELM